MPTRELLTADDIEELSLEGFEAQDPTPVIAKLVAAADEGRLADPLDAPIVFGLAAEIAEESGDLEAALGYAERAVAIHREHGTPAALPRAFRAKLLVSAGRDEEGIAELTELRPLLTEDPDLVEPLTDALMTADQGETAERWLTEALRTVMERVASASTFDHVSGDATVMVLTLARERHELRHELGLPHDESDEMAMQLERTLDEALAGAADLVGSTVLFWPRAEFDRLEQRLPDVAETCGPTWDEHRAGVERALVERSEAGLGGSAVAVGTVDDLADFAGGRGVDVDDPDADDDYLDGYVDQLDASGRTVPWPPARNEPCWCGSGSKYKKCCLPRSRA